MLTPEQIKAHKFRVIGKGAYDSADVDSFFQEAVGAFVSAQENASQLQKNNDELYQRVEALANALNQLRAERDVIQKTMIAAQKMADELTSKTQEETDKLRAQAKLDAEEMLGQAQAEVETLALAAQAQAETLQAKARAHAEKLFEEARTKAQEELVTIAAKTQREEQELARLRGQSAKLRNTLLDALAAQMKIIEQMPAEDEEEQQAAALPQSFVFEVEPEPQEQPQEEPEEPEEQSQQEPEVELEPEDENDIFAQLKAQWSEDSE